MKKSSYSYGLALVAIFIVLRFFFIPTYKFLTSQLHPLAIDVYTSIFVVVVLALLLKGKLKNFSSLKPAEKLDYFKLLVPAIIGGIALDVSILYLPVKTVSVFISLLPIFVSLYSGWLLKEPVSKNLWMAAILAAVGAIIFKTGGIIEFGLGDFLVLIGVLLFAFAPILNRKFIGKVGTYELMFLGFAIGMIPIAVLAIFLGVMAPLPSDAFYLEVFAGYLIFLTLATSAIATYVVKLIPAHTFVTLTTALVPIGAISLGIFALGEKIYANEILGGAIMIGAAMLAIWASNNKK